MAISLDQPFHIKYTQSKSGFLTKKTEKDGLCTTHAVNKNGKHRTELRCNTADNTPFFNEFIDDLKLASNGKIKSKKGKSYYSIDNQEHSEAGIAFDMKLWDLLQNERKKNAAHQIYAEDKAVRQQMKDKQHESQQEQRHERVKHIKVHLRPALDGSVPLKDRVFNIRFGYNPNQIEFVDDKGDKKYIDFESIEKRAKELVLKPDKHSDEPYGWIVIFDAEKDANDVEHILQYGLDQLKKIHSAYDIDEYNAYDYNEDMYLDDVDAYDYNVDDGYNYLGSRYYANDDAIYGNEANVRHHQEGFFILSIVVLMGLLTLLCFCVGTICGFGMAQFAKRENVEADEKYIEYDQVSNEENNEDI